MMRDCYVIINSDNYPVLYWIELIITERKFCWESGSFAQYCGKSGFVYNIYLVGWMF